MSEPESPPTKTADGEVLKKFERIKPAADAQAIQTDVPDTRALEGQEDLNIAGYEWLKQEIKHTQHLHYVRLFLLGALLILVVVWLLSVVVLLIMIGFHLGGFD